MNRKYIYGALSMLVAVLLSQLVIYELFIIPTLEERKMISVVWWVICLVPIILACFLAAHISSSKKETVLFGGVQSVVLAAVWSCFRYMGRPGHLKATVSPAESLFLLMFSVLFVGVFIGGVYFYKSKIKIASE